MTVPYLISEIRDELNRISTVWDAQRLFGTDIFRLLISMGYVEERKENGKLIQTPTEQGRSKGIEQLEKISERGNVYYVLTYPLEVQREIVEHYARVKMMR